MSSFVRTACLTGFREVALGAGLDPARLLADAGVAAAALDDPDQKLPVERALHLLESASARARDDSFGLRMAETRRLSNLGAVGLLMRDQSTLRDGLDVLVRYHRTLNGALSMDIEESCGVVVLHADLVTARRTTARQGAELALGVLMRVLRQFLGGEWQPRQVCLAHAAPRDTGLHQRVFGRTPKFDADDHAIVCHAADLDARNPGADRAMARYAQQLLDASVGAHAPTLLEDVRHAIALSLPSGRCGMRAISEQLGLAGRTVQRRLAEQGAAFSTLVDEVRIALAARHLGDGTRPLGEIAGLLGFAQQSGFSRWHRDKFGCSPKERRASFEARSPT